MELPNMSTIIENQKDLMDTWQGFLLLVSLVVGGAIFLPWYINIIILIYIIYLSVKVKFLPAVFITYVASAIVYIIIPLVTLDYVTDTKITIDKIKYLDESIIVLENNVTITDKELIYKCLYSNCKAIETSVVTKHSKHTLLYFTKPVLYDVYLLME